MCIGKSNLNGKIAIGRLHCWMISILVQTKHKFQLAETCRIATCMLKLPHLNCTNTQNSSRYDNITTPRLLRYIELQCVCKISILRMLRHKELQYVCKNQDSSTTQMQRSTLHVLKFDSSKAKTQRIGICMLKLQVLECYGAKNCSVHATISTPRMLIYIELLKLRPFNHSDTQNCGTYNKIRFVEC